MCRAFGSVLGFWLCGGFEGELRVPSLAST